MTKTLAEIQEMLDALPSKNFRFDTVREDALTYTGALRTAEGQNLVEPSPESASMVLGLRPVIDFLVASPEIVQQLLDQLDTSMEASAVVPAPAKANLG